MADKVKPAGTERAPNAVETGNLVTVKAIRSFEGVEGFKNPSSEPFDVSEQRAKDLTEGGLVEIVEAKVK